MNKWLDILRQQVADHGQPSVAELLGISAATVSLVVNEKYKGDMNRIEKLVEKAFLQKCVNCPVLGDLPLFECMKHQVRKGISSNPLYMQLYKACRSGCHHSSLKERLKRRDIKFQLRHRGKAKKKPGKGFESPHKKLFWFWD